MSNIELTAKAKTYRELQTMIKELEAEAEAVKAVIIANMGERDTVQTDIFTIKYTVYQTSRVDTSALKNELPDIAARYTKTVEARRFQVA